jgi:hypothetical protein
LAQPLHVQVVESEPPQGTPVAGPLGEVKVVFDGTVGDGSSLEVIDASFARKDIGATRIEDDTVLAVDVADDALGELTVQFNAVDPADGYVSTGALSLMVVPGDDASTPEAGAGTTAMALGLAALVAVALGLILRRRAAERPDAGTGG